MTYRYIWLGVGVLSYFSYFKIAGGINELEENDKLHKVFDPVKAKAQIQVYKDLYNLDGKGQGNLKLTKNIKPEDKEKIKEFFNEDVDQKLSRI